MSTPPARVREAQEVLDLAGTSLGPSDWVDVTQERVDAFARSVDDWRWVHNDPRRAALGPFGRTIGHAHLTLGIIPGLFHSLLRFADGVDPMFYGYNRVRFPEPVPVGARVRLHADVEGVEDLGVAEQLVVDLRVECEGTERPACVAQAVFRHYRVAAPA